MIYKILWAFRFVFLKLFWARCGCIGYIGKPVYLLGMRKVVIGNRVRVFPGLRLEVHNEGRLVIGDNISIGQDCHLTCGQKLAIGDGTVITNQVMITDIDHEYRQIGKPILEQGLLLSETIIGKNCFIGSGAKIQAGTVLGDHCVVGANSVVRGVFPFGSVIVGIPGHIIKQYTDESWVKMNYKSND